VQRTFNPLASITDQQGFEYVVNYGLVGDEAKARLLINRRRASKARPYPLSRALTGKPLAFWVPYA